MLNFSDDIYRSWRQAQEATPAKPETPPPTELDPTMTLDEAQNIATQTADKPEGPPVDDLETATPQETPPVEPTPASREEQVKESVGNLSNYLNEVAKSVYQMQLTQNQLQEITTKAVTMISDYVSNITVERVKNIAEQFMKVEAKKRIAKQLRQEYGVTNADYEYMSVYTPEDIKYINSLHPAVKALLWQVGGIVKGVKKDIAALSIVKYCGGFANGMIREDNIHSQMQGNQMKEAVKHLFNIDV